MEVDIDKCKHRIWMLVEPHGVTIMARCRECGVEAEFHEVSSSYEYHIVTEPMCTRESFMQHDLKRFYAEYEHIAELSN